MSPKRRQPTDLKAIVVDDEAASRQLLCEHLAEVDGVEVISECANGFEAVARIGELKPDLVFLDIQMPKLDGFDVVELLGTDPPAIVFVTAYDEHAIRAFDVSAVDYLLKPISSSRLIAAIDRVRDRGASAGRAATEAVLAQRSASSPLRRVLIRDGSQIHVVHSDEIDFIEAQDDYVALAVDGSKLRRQQTLTQLHSRLDAEQFVRIHRSYVLNIDRLVRLELYAKDSRVAILRDGSRLPVSRSGYGRLRELL